MFSALYIYIVIFIFMFYSIKVSQLCFKFVFLFINNPMRKTLIYWIDMYYDTHTHIYIYIYIVKAALFSENNAITPVSVKLIKQLK